MINTRAFWNLFKPATAKFTLEELRELYGVLVRNPVVSEANRAVVVETIRRVAEYMIWGDQNEPRIFDFFLENNIMTYLHKVLLQPANRSGEVAKQVLQTLSIIIQNVRSETAIFFMFSNNHINNIVDLDFDFEDDEVLGYYISFLKTISLKLNRGTVQFFINTHRDATGFPLYTRAIKLAHNKEGMVRAAVRTLTLHVYSVDDPHIIDFVTSQPASQYFADVAVYLAEQILLLDRRLLGAEAGGSQALASLDSQLAEVEDVVSYVSDLLSLGVPSIAQLLASSVWQHVTHPLLLKPLMQPGAAAAAASLRHQQPQQSPIRPGIAAGSRSSGSLLGSPYKPKAASPMKGSGWSSNGPVAMHTDSGNQSALVRPVCALYVLERLFHLVMYAPLLQQLLLALTCGGINNASGTLSDTAPNSIASSSSSSSGDDCVSCRSTLLGILTSSAPYPAVMVLRLLVAILHNRHISPELLLALSILPRRVVQQHGVPGVAFSNRETSNRDSTQLAVMVQVVLQQLQELSVADQRQEDAASSSHGLDKVRSGPHRRSSSKNLLNLLTQQYLPNQLHALVQGKEQHTQQHAGDAALTAAAFPGASNTSTSGVMQGLETWLEMAEEVVATAAPSEAAASSSTFSALGPQLLAALLQLLQLPGLPPQGIRLLGWLLHELLPLAPLPEAPHVVAVPHTAKEPAAELHPQSVSIADHPLATGHPEAAGDQHLTQSSSTDSGSSTVIERSESIDAEGSLSRSSSLVSGAGASTECDSIADLQVTPPPVSISHVSSSPSVACDQHRASVLSSQQLQQLQAAVDAALGEFQQQLHSMWCEAVFPMLAQEWTASREMLQRPVLRAGSDALLSGTAVWPLLQGLQAAAAAASGAGGGGASYDALSASGKAALACYLAVQRVAAVSQLQELLLTGAVSRQPPVPTVTEADLKQVDIQEGYQVDLAPGSALPCVVSFAPGQERRVYFAVAGLSTKQLLAVQSSSGSSNHQSTAQEASAVQASLLRSLPLAVLADPSPNRPQAGIVLSVAPLLGAHPYTDPNVPKWLHVHVRPSVRGLLRVIKSATAKKGGLLTAMRQLADGHWVLAFSSADKAAGAVRLVEMHVAHLQRLYGDALTPLCGHHKVQEQQTNMQAQLVEQQQTQQLKQSRQQQAVQEPQQQETTPQQHQALTHDEVLLGTAEATAAEAAAQVGVDEHQQSSAVVAKQLAAGHEAAGVQNVVQERDMAAADAPEIAASDSIQESASQQIAPQQQADQLL